MKNNAQVFSTFCVWIFGFILIPLSGISQDKHLFELDNPDYTKESNPERYQWEQEFIAFAKETEKKPENYVRHILKLMEINGESHELITYRSNYMWHFYTYYYDQFKDPAGYLYEKPEIKKAYLHCHISRSAENINRLWSVFGPIVSEIAAPSLKEGSPERGYIQTLVNNWDCMKGTKNYSKKLDEIYVKLSENYYYGDELWAMLKPLMCKSNSKNGSVSFSWDSDRAWVYTFWVRRHHEGNADAVYTILKSLID